MNGFAPIPSTHCCKENNKVQLKDKETRMFLNSKARKEVRPGPSGAYQMSDISLLAIKQIGPTSMPNKADV